MLHSALPNNLIGGTDRCVPGLSERGEDFHSERENPGSSELLLRQPVHLPCVRERSQSDRRERVPRAASGGVCLRRACLPFSCFSLDSSVQAV